MNYLFNLGYVADTRLCWLVLSTSTVYESPEKALDSILEVLREYSRPKYLQCCKDAKAANHKYCSECGWPIKNVETDPDRSLIKLLCELQTDDFDNQSILIGNLEAVGWQMWPDPKLPMITVYDVLRYIEGKQLTYSENHDLH